MRETKIDRFSGGSITVSGRIKTARSISMLLLVLQLEKSISMDASMRCFNTMSNVMIFDSCVVSNSKCWICYILFPEVICTVYQYKVTPDTLSSYISNTGYNVNYERKTFTNLDSVPCNMLQCM